MSLNKHLLFSISSVLVVLALVLLFSEAILNRCSTAPVANALHFGGCKNLFCVIKNIVNASSNLCKKPDRKIFLSYFIFYLHIKPETTQRENPPALSVTFPKHRITEHVTFDRVISVLLRSPVFNVGSVTTSPYQCWRVILY